MNDKELLAWAAKAGAFPELSRTPDKDAGFLRRFAALVAAHEREQCALVCENYQATWAVSGKEFAKAIRART